MLLNRALIFILLISSISLQKQAFSEVLSGSVNKEYVFNGTGIVIDRNTNLPVDGAVVSVPSKNMYTTTNNRGEFNLDLPTDNPVILSVKKDGYKAFSAVLGKPDLSRPMRIGLLERALNEIVINSELHHLGDNKFSERSANAGEFSGEAVGPYFIQEFYLDNVDLTKNIRLKIGSIIGIDTKIAQLIRQSNVRSSSSSPVEVFLNSRKIGEISVNGDNHALSVPPGLLKAYRYNIVKIHTGVNLDSDRDVDYDDIEFMNLFLDIGGY